MADVDWRAIQLEYCRHYVDALNDETGLQLEFVDMTSPAYYNYSTDRLFVSIPTIRANRIRKEVEGYSDWPQYIKDNFTSYDGFWSNYSSDYKNEEWTRDALDQCQWMSIVKLWLKHKFEGDWAERELYLGDEFDLGEWETINTACDVINKYIETESAKRLEELRVEIENERISYGEIAELQGLAKYIDSGDILLLEWAGVPEFSESETEELPL
jgi:hypothetical protein